MLIYGWWCCSSCCYYESDDDDDERHKSNATGYQEITIGSDGDTDEEEDPNGRVWRLSILGSSSSSNSGGEENDEERELSVKRIMSEENSVDDVEYYRLYVPFGHKLKRSHKSSRKASAFIAQARTKATACLDATTKKDYLEIRALYEKALDRCPLSQKPLVVREYEAFNETYLTFTLNTDEYNKATSLAHNYWHYASLLDHTLTRRQDYYRRALMIMPDSRLKAEWKRLYNVFYKNIS